MYIDDLQEREVVDVQVLEIEDEVVADLLDELFLYMLILYPELVLLKLYDETDEQDDLIQQVIEVEVVDEEVEDAYLYYGIQVLYGQLP